MMMTNYYHDRDYVGKLYGEDDDADDDDDDTDDDDDDTDDDDYDNDDDDDDGGDDVVDDGDGDHDGSVVDDPDDVDDHDGYSFARSLIRISIRLLVYLMKLAQGSTRGALHQVSGHKDLKARFTYSCQEDAGSTPLVPSQT